MISKPKSRIDQIKAMRSCANSFLEMINLVENETLVALQYLLGVTNLEMAEFALKYSFKSMDDKERAKIHQRVFRSTNLISKTLHTQNLKIHDSTLNTVVYLEFPNLLTAEFKPRLIKTIETSDQLLQRLQTRQIRG